MWLIGEVVNLPAVLLLKLFGAKDNHIMCCSIISSCQLLFEDCKRWFV